jgi:hypothetical protein
LSGPAPSGGLKIALASDVASVTVPAYVTIPAGQSSAKFAIKTNAVETQLSATISATLNGTTLTAVLGLG